MYDHLSDYYHDGYYAGATEKDFVVEDLLDFSNDGDDEGAFDAVTGNLTDSGIANATGSGSGGDGYCSSAFIDCGPYFSDNLCEPCEDSAELEWLSNFVEDCFSNKLDNQKLQPISHNKPISPSSSETTRLGGGSQSSRPVPAKARSKRNRGAPTNWSSKLPLVISPSPSPSPSLDNTCRYASSEGRKCLHCGSDKTPQWRTGPMGPKTLCNACGVRYKSGRLVPEYRPAASPSFVMSEHSNSHRKVVELRRQKEMEVQQQQQALFWSEDDKSFLIN